MPQTQGVATVLTTDQALPHGLFRYTDRTPPYPSSFYRLRRE